MDCPMQYLIFDTVLRESLQQNHGFAIAGDIHDPPKSEGLQAAIHSSPANDYERESLYLPVKIHAP